MTEDDWNEEGRRVNEYGMIVYDWPPKGRFRELWSRLTAITTEEERIELAALISNEIHENSTLVAYTDEQDHWVDVEPDWSTPAVWLRDDKP